MKTLIFTGYGINSDLELAECFKRAGSTAEIKHLNEIIADKKSLFDFDIIAFPGGFSFGDHIASGKIFANQIKTFLFPEIQEFIKRGHPVLGICNGFQVLVKCGLLPNLETVSAEGQQATLMHNDSGKFENRWVTLKANPHNDSFWLKNIETIELSVRHGEGKFYIEQELLFSLKQNQQIALQYVDHNKICTDEYPANPNGSLSAIAALTNKEGNVLGMMPHPEVYMDFYHKPNWTQQDEVTKIGERPISHRLKKKDGQGMIFFYNAVDFIQNQ